MKASESIESLQATWTYFLKCVQIAACWRDALSIREDSAADSMHATQTRVFDRLSEIASPEFAGAEEIVAAMMFILQFETLKDFVESAAKYELIQTASPRLKSGQERCQKRGMNANESAADAASKVVEGWWKGRVLKNEVTALFRLQEHGVLDAAWRAYFVGSVMRNMLAHGRTVVDADYVDEIGRIRKQLQLDDQATLDGEAKLGDRLPLSIGLVISYFYAVVPLGDSMLQNLSRPAC